MLIPINALSISRGDQGKKGQYYHFYGVDSAGNQVILTFECPFCYTDSAEKTFSRLIPVIIHEEEKKEEKKEESKIEVIHHFTKSGEEILP